MVRHSQSFLVFSLDPSRGLYRNTRSVQLSKATSGSTVWPVHRRRGAVGSLGEQDPRITECLAAGRAPCVSGVSACPLNHRRVKALQPELSCQSYLSREQPWKPDILSLSGAEGGRARHLLGTELCPTNSHVEVLSPDLRM